MTMKTNEDVQDHRILLDWSLATAEEEAANGTHQQLLLPIDMRFNDGHMLSIVVYSVLMVFSAIGNLTVLVLILRRRRKTPSRINTTLMHLAIADLLVTFLMMPLEIGWAYTVSWKAGDAMCRIMAFFRMFGLYLSSFILVCISMDRGSVVLISLQMFGYYAVLKPLHLTELDKRGKFMLSAAWMGATICSIPQMLVFHVEAHPNITWYEQCITYNVLPSYTHEILYSVFGMMMMYTFPLVVIIFSYASILMEIYRRTRTNIGADRIRRSSLGFLGRAKIRTLKMTIIIVLVFFVCWTPYHVMMLWYWYDRDTAIHVDQRIQRGLFLFACTNSCMNPIVYGVFNIRARRAGTQTKFNNSQNNTGSYRHTAGLDVVCHVSWKKPHTVNADLATPDAANRKSFRYANGVHWPRTLSTKSGNDNFGDNTDATNVTSNGRTRCGTSRMSEYNRHCAAAAADGTSFKDNGCHRLNNANSSCSGSNLKSSLKRKSRYKDDPDVNYTNDTFL